LRPYLFAAAANNKNFLAVVFVTFNVLDMLMNSKAIAAKVSRE
jgi:hypothetical protein